MLECTYSICNPKTSKLKAGNFVIFCVTVNCSSCMESRKLDSERFKAKSKCALEVYIIARVCKIKQQYIQISKYIIRVKRERYAASAAS